MPVARSKRGNVRARRRGDGTIDAILNATLLVGATVYVASLPRVLGLSDEGLLLYEAKRLLAGEVFYRDVFDLITPGAHYLMAGLFWLFGTSMATARIADAVLQGAIVATIYTTCRVLDVRRGLAAAAGLSHIAALQSAWPVVSPHWLATFLGVRVLLVLLRRRMDADARSALVPGVLVGLLVAVQQHKGTVMGMAAAVALVLDHLLIRHGSQPGWGSLGRTLATLLGGTALVVVPLSAFLVATAGVQPVFAALVLHPLLNYGPRAGYSWGYVGPLGWYLRYTFPTLLRYLPVPVAILGVRAFREWRRGRQERFRQSALLTIFALAAIGSVFYSADCIHLAFAAPMVVVVVADIFEWAIGIRFPRAAATVVVALLNVALALQLARVMVGSWADHPYSYASQFGRVQFRTPGEIEMVQAIRDAAQANGPTEVFIYPAGAGMYLLTGTSNPTPFQFLAPGYSRPDQLDALPGMLERRRVRVVVVFVPPEPSSLLATYLARHFEPVPGQHGRPLVFQRVEAP